MNGSETGKAGNIFTIFGILLLLFVVTGIWCIPRSIGDLFISLAAGRDVMSGRLNSPDDWSFSTGGKAWINQNWGADTILYLVEKTFGDTGLLAVKAILLLLCSLFLILALLKLKIPLAVSILVSAIIMVSINVFTILRPNLFSLAFTPLLLMLLYKSFDSPRMIWAAVTVTVLWANIHAGFIFGLGMMCLWTVCVILPEVLKKKWEVIKNKWQLIAGTAAAVLLSGLANPFGFINLVFPFTMVQGGVWLGIRDWRPIWETGELSRFANGIANFIIILGIIAILLALRCGFTVFNYFRSKQKGSPDKKPVQDKSGISIIIFEAITALVSIIMAVISNRFIMIALVMLSPILGRQILWLLNSIKFYRISLAVMYGIVFIYGSLIIYNNIRNYDPNNPVMNTGTGSFFEKMHYVNMNYNPRLVRFINTNHIGGNVISPWEWEGYLKWNCPQMKIFIGGRAQQVYSKDTIGKFLYLSGNDVEQFQGKAPEDILDSIDAHFIITGNTKSSDETILTALNCGNWVIVYADESNLMFANTHIPAAAGIVELMNNNTLVFEDSSAEALSKAAFIFSQPDRWESEKVIDLFTNAFEQASTWLWAYNMLFDYTQSNDKIFAQVPILLDKQLARLEKLQLDGPDAQNILLCRIYISSALHNYAVQINLKNIAAEEHRINTESQNLYFELLKKWKQVLAF